MELEFEKLLVTMANISGYISDFDFDFEVYLAIYCKTTCKFVQGNISIFAL